MDSVLPSTTGKMAAPDCLNAFRALRIESVPRRTTASCRMKSSTCFWRMAGEARSTIAVRSCSVKYLTELRLR